MTEARNCRGRARHHVGVRTGFEAAVLGEVRSREAAVDDLSGHGRHGGDSAAVRPHSSGVERSGRPSMSSSAWIMSMLPICLHRTRRCGS